MSVKPEDIEAYVAGELPEAEAERVLTAILEDEEGAAELEHCLQMRAMGPDLVRTAAAPRRASRRRWAYAGIAAIVAAAAASVFVCRRSATETAEPQQLALAPHRGIAARLSWSGADGHRPYDTERGSDAARPEALSFKALARIEATRDPDAIVAGHVLVGNLERARQVLGESANAWSDRAAISLASGDAEGALVAAARALEMQPAHPQARWNHALAAQALRLDRVAAAELERIAAAGERGWSEEARMRANALTAQRTERAAAYDAVRSDGEAMLSGGPVEPMLSHVESFGGLARLYFYDAIRLATDPARVRALAPLARALDAKYGGDILARHVEQAAWTLPLNRASLAARYAALRGDQPVDVKALIRDAAKDRDIALGAMLIGGTAVNQVDAGNLDAYVRLAEATADPWFATLAIEQRALAALALGEIDRAEAVLREAKCDGAIAYRCQRVAFLQAHVYITLARTKAAERAWQKSHTLALVEGVPFVEHEVLSLGTTLAVLRDGVSGSLHPLAAAYLEELERTGTFCGSVRDARQLVAQSLINRGEVSAARALIKNEPACDVPFTPTRAFVLAQLVDGRVAADALLAEVEKLRAAALPGERAMLDHVEGRVRLEMGEPRGHEILERAAAVQPVDAFTRRVRSYDYAVLVEDAAKRGAFEEVLRLLARERDAELPVRCAIGISEETSLVVVVRGADGTITGTFGPRGAPSVPTAALATCSVVDVFARAPHYGRPELVRGLPARFRASGDGARRAGAGPVLIVANPNAPAELEIAPLQPVSAPAEVRFLAGADATPGRVLEAMKTASFIEIHAHSLVGDDTNVVVLSDDGYGHYTLGVQELASVKLAGHPVVVLAACETARAGTTLDTTWSLADAFLAAGASAVIASQSPIGDAGAPQFFADVRARVTAGANVSRALYEARAAVSDEHRRSWIDRLVVFQ